MAKCERTLSEMSRDHWFFNDVSPDERELGALAVGCLQRIADALETIAAASKAAPDPLSVPGRYPGLPPLRFGDDCIDELRGKSRHCEKCRAVAEGKRITVKQARRLALKNMAGQESRRKRHYRARGKRQPYIPFDGGGPPGIEKAKAKRTKAKH